MTTVDLISWRDVAELCTAMFAFAAAYRSIHNGKQIEKLNIEINSRMTQLLDKIASASHAEGVLAGRKEMKEENNKTHDVSV